MRTVLAGNIIRGKPRIHEKRQEAVLYVYYDLYYNNLSIGIELLTNAPFPLSLRTGTSSQLNGLQGGDDGNMPPPLLIKKKHSAM